MHDHHHDNGPLMNQMIFKIGLSVETISVYLLCCGLADAGNAITTKHLVEVWSGTQEALEEGLSTLEDKCILSKIISDQADRNVYKVANIRHWKIK